MLGGFRPRYVPIDVAVSPGENRKGVQGGFSKLFTPQIVDTSRGKSCEILVTDARRGRGPINERGVAELLGKGRRASRLKCAKYGSNGKAFSITKVAGGVSV